MAVAASDRVIHLYDEQGQKRDKFSIRPADKDNRSYIVRAINFSPDSQKLAIAQSDNIVFIYKLGAEWGDKKSICNKFPQNSSVTCMCWPAERNGELVIGLAEGKVKVGNLKTNKSQSLFGFDSFVVALSSSPDGNSIVAGYLDGSLITFNLDTKAKLKIQHSTIPYALAWGTHILAAGNDGKIAFFEPGGDSFQRFDFSKDERVKEFTCASFNATGETCVIGNYDRFYVFNFNNKRPQWDEICCKKIENYYSVTSVAWKHDGSKIGIGSLCGSVDVFDVCLKKSRYKGKFEFTYVSLSQVIVKRIESSQRIVLKSAQGYEISKINVYQDRYLVASTHSTLLLGDMETCTLSELPWRGSGNEKFDFSNPNICMIFNAGELSIVEYGVNEVIGTCRTENIHPNLISARLNYA
jgi:intraflagellar transport protein 172